MSRNPIFAKLESLISSIQACLRRSSIFCFARLRDSKPSFRALPCEHPRFANLLHAPGSFAAFVTVAPLLFCLIAAAALSQSATSAEVRSSKPISYQSLENIVNNWLKRPDLLNSTIGIEVMELPSGRVLYSLNGSRRFVSASTAKVLTTACAYDLLGPNYKYKTTLYGTGNQNVNGKGGQTKVAGNLILQPSQDPSLTQDDLRQLFASVNQRKPLQVDGSFYVGTVPGGSDNWVTAWLSEDWGQSWMPPSSNLSVDENVAQGNLVIKGYKIQNLGPDTIYNAGSQSLLNAGISAAWVECDPHNHELSFYRSPGMSLGAPLVVANPSVFNQALAEMIASDTSIHFSNRSVRDLNVYALAEHQSKPLSAILQTCLHESDNFYAQQILRTLGLAKLDAPPDVSQMLSPKVQKGPAPSTLEDAGLRRLSAWLTKSGVPAQETVLFDGCGLSRKDGISPHALNAVLKHMATPSCNGPYLQLLKRYNPVGRGDGWFAYKTGSMDTARSVSGVLQTVGGQYCAVTIMVNGHRQSVGALKGEIDSLVAVLDSIKSIKLEEVGQTPGTKPAMPLKGGNNAIPQGPIPGKTQAGQNRVPTTTMKNTFAPPQPGGQNANKELSGKPDTQNVNQVSVNGQIGSTAATTMVELSPIAPAPHIVRHKRHRASH